MHQAWREGWNRVPLLHLESNQRNEYLADGIDAEIEVLQGGCSDQHQIVGLPAEDDRRRDFLVDADFDRRHRFGGNWPVGILDLSSSKGVHTNLRQQGSGHLGEMGSCVNQPFQLEGASGITWIAHGEFHVKGSHEYMIVGVTRAAVNA